MIRLTIGRLARTAGVHVETVRYYQRRGLIAVPPRPTGSVRHYPQTAVGQLRFIKRAQDIGFSLAEIKQLLRLQRDRKSTGLNSSHVRISYAVFCLKKKKKK